MAGRVLVDSGPLVALLNRRDIHHAWAQRELVNLHEPLLTSEAVLSEVFCLLSRIPNGTSLLLDLLRDVLVSTRSDFSYHAVPTQILRHFARYSSMPMSV